MQVNADAQVGKKGHIKVKGALPLAPPTNASTADGVVAAVEAPADGITVDIKALKLKMQQVYSGGPRNDADPLFCSVTFYSPLRAGCERKMVSTVYDLLSRRCWKLVPHSEPDPPFGPILRPLTWHAWTVGLTFMLAMDVVYVNECSVCSSSCLSLANK